MRRNDIIVMANSPAWCSAIERTFQSAKLSWVLNFESLVDEATNGHGAAAIVEIPSRSLPHDWIQLVPLINNSWQVKLFAVADFELQPWSRLLAGSGFSAWFNSLLQVPSLELCVRKHLRSIPPPLQSTETRIWSELPWPSATSSRDA